MTKNQIKDLFDNIDADQNGVIEYDEFIAASINKEKIMNK